MRHYNTSNKLLGKLQVITGELQQLLHDPGNQLSKEEEAAIADAMDKVVLVRYLVMTEGKSNG